MKIYILQLIIPIIILALAILVSNANFDTPDPPPPLKVTLDSYKSPVTLISASDGVSWESLDKNISEMFD